MAGASGSGRGKGAAGAAGKEGRRKGKRAKKAKAPPPVGLAKLKRDSNFHLTYAFRNALPMPGPGCKLALGEDRLAGAAALLEQLVPESYRWPLVTSGHLGVPLDVAALSSYALPPPCGPGPSALRGLAKVRAAARRRRPVETSPVGAIRRRWAGGDLRGFGWLGGTDVDPRRGDGRSWTRRTSTW